MNCKKIQLLSLMYHEQLLDENQKSEVEQHLHNCPHCLQFYKATETTVAAMNQMKESKPEVSFYFTEKTLAKIASHSPESTLSQWVVSVLFSKTKIISASIAALFVGIVLGVLLNNNYNINNSNYTDTNFQTVEEIYLAETSDDYMMRFFDNQKYLENGNE